jgi:hypothetical protein
MSNNKNKKNNNNNISNNKEVKKLIDWCNIENNDDKNSPKNLSGNSQNFIETKDKNNIIILIFGGQKMNKPLKFSNNLYIFTESKKILFKNNNIL